VGWGVCVVYLHCPVYSHFSLPTRIIMAYVSVPCNISSHADPFGGVTNKPHQTNVLVSVLFCCGGMR